MYKFGEDPYVKFQALAPFVLGRQIQAVYYDQSVPQAQGNPLAAILQEDRSKTEIARLLVKRPPSIDPAIRTRPSSERYKRLIADLDDLYAPRNLDLQLAQRVEHAMYHSLHGRNPLAPSVAFRSPEKGFTILGPAGVGKSAMVQHVLVDLYPQRITHTHFQRQPFEFDQILWMVLTIPSLGTVKELCKTFFQYAGVILKKPYYEYYTKGGRASDDRMLANMRTVIANHGIALLVLEEIGNLATKGAESERQLNALFELLNSTGVAVCLTGTFEALPFLRAHGRVLGRISAHGDWIWDRLTEKSRGWEAILKAYQPLQYVQHPVELRGDIAQAFYFETQGFIRMFKELYHLTQRAAMDDHSERLTPELIHRTAKKEWKLLRPMLTAFRLGDRKVLEKYPQMFPDLDDSSIHHAARDGRIEGALCETPEVRIHCSTSKTPQTETECNKAAPSNSLPKKLAKGKHPRRRKKGYISPLRTCEGTLAQVVADGRQAHTTPTAYSALQASGLVRTPLELLPVEKAAAQASLKNEAQG